MRQTFEPVFIVDCNGDWAIGSDYDTAVENYDNEVGGGATRRVINLKVNVTLPEDGEVSVNVPDTAGEKITAEAI
jgi:hypothetical protein